MIQISTYQLKRGFQKLLTPCRDFLIKRKVSANAITCFAILVCLIYSALMSKGLTFTLVLLPFLLLFRMILNALDGMVAVKTNTQSKLGMVLNEAGDIISDLALFLGFIAFLGSLSVWLYAVILVSVAIEIASLYILAKRGARPFAGPFGKSDRAVFMGVLGLCLYWQVSNAVLVLLFMGALVLATITVNNRWKVKA